MRFRKAALILALVFVVVLLAAGAWAWNAQARLYSSPTAARTNETYLRTHAPPTNAPPVPTDLFASITVEQTTNQLKITFPGLSMWSDIDYAPLETHRVASTETVTVGDGSVRLAYIASAWAVPRTNFGWSTDVPSKFFRPDLTPVSTNGTFDLVPKYDRTLSFKGEFPVARFYFAFTNLPGVKPLRFRTADARTQHPLSQGYRGSTLKNAFWYESDLRLWHQTPVELTATIATGPEQTVTLSPEPGAELRYPGGVIRLLAVSQVYFSSTGTTSDGGTNIMTLRADEGFDEGRPPASYIFYTWPATALRGDLEFLGHDGKKLEDQGGSSSDSIVHRSIMATTNAVKEIRFRYFPNAHRLTFVIPELPGLPEQNRNIENLFDVHVPYMRIRYEYNFQQNIAQLLQMQSHSVPLTFSNAFFPVIRTNTTPRALFKEMAGLLSNRDHQLVADPVANKIESRPHPLRVLLQKIRDKFGL